MNKPFEACKTCYLKNAPLVRPQTQREATIAVVGEAPGVHEVEEGRPFVGASGRELKTALGPYLQHYRLHVTNAVLCQPPANDMEKARTKAKRAGLTDPVKACHSRLQEELHGYRNIITLGGTALESVAGVRGVMGQRGFPLEASRGGGESVRARIMPTVHPAFVLRRARWRHVFRSDISKAFRFFSDELRFKLPRVVYCPSASTVEKFFNVYKSVIADVETDGLEPLVANLRCIGLRGLRDGAGHGAVLVVPFRSVLDRPEEAVAFGESPNVTRFYNPESMWRIRRAIASALKTHVWVGHNLGMFDRMVLERAFAVPMKKPHDTILLHHASESELPHSLAFLGSLHTDITSWKEERHGLDYKTDKDLWLYNAKDVVVTGEVIAPLQSDVKLREQERIYAIDRKVQSMCVDLHRNGLGVDRAAIARHAAAFSSRKAIAEVKVQRVAESHGLKDFNPGSYQQVGELLYDKIGIPFKPQWETDSGGRGTSMQVLREMLVSDERTEPERKLLLDLHEYRRAGKFLSSFVESLTVLADGRVHADFNPTGTVSGRLGGGSEDNPSLLTIPSQLRDVFIAAPGHVFVAADMDQIELRMIAALSGSRNYIRVFNAGEDPHALTSDLIYGKVWREQTKDQKDKLRGFAKRFSYACAYGAGNRTVLEVMRSVEGRNGGFPYLKTSLGEVVRNQRAWLGANPEIESWWETTIQKWREEGYLADLIHGRKRFFLDGIDRNAMVNYPVQATSIALVHEATFELYEEHGLTFEFEGKGTGLVHQGHDQLIFECKESSAERVKNALTRAMNRSYDFLPVKFTSTAKVGKSWADLK